MTRDCFGQPTHTNRGWTERAMLSATPLATASRTCPRFARGKQPRTATERGMRSEQPATALCSPVDALQPAAVHSGMDPRVAPVSSTSPVSPEKADRPALSRYLAQRGSLASAPRASLALEQTLETPDGKQTPESNCRSAPARKQPPWAPATPVLSETRANRAPH